MSPTNNDKACLNADLTRLFAGERVEESALSIEEILKRNARIADRTARHLSSRKGSEYLLNQLDYEELNQVGKFTKSQRDKKEKSKEYKIISYRGELGELNFYFRKTGQFIIEEESQEPAITFRKNDLVSLNEYHDRVQATIGGAILGIKPKPTPEEVLINNPRLLDNYVLELVEKVTQTPRKVWGHHLSWLPTAKKEVVYSRQKAD